MGAFAPAEHELVGAELVYLPTGSSPYARPEADAHTILLSGDSVTVLSAWRRPYLDDDAPTLLFIESHHTGARTHVVAGDLRELSACEHNVTSIRHNSETGATRHACSDCDATLATL